MVELIRDQGIISAENGLEDATIGIEAAGIENGIIGAVELADLLLELLVDILGAADKSYGRHAISVGVHHVLGRLDDLLTHSSLFFHTFLLSAKPR